MKAIFSINIIYTLSFCYLKKHQYFKLLWLLQFDSADTIYNTYKENQIMYEIDVFINLLT